VTSMHALRRAGEIVALLLALGAAACAPQTRNAVPPGTSQPDRFLFDRGMAALKEKKWITAREFFKQVVETYTQSPVRPDAKLGLGDTYLGENTAESLVLAINEYTEFLSFYPTNARADYAQYKLGMAHFKQMRAAQRDQTETKEAIKTFQTFVDRWPTPCSAQVIPPTCSELLNEVKGKLRQARDRLNDSDYQVGFYYYRARWYPGSIDRFKALLKEDPEYTHRDAVYFYLGESLVKVKLEAEALPYYERLVKEFEQSEYLEEARKRIAALKLDAQSKAQGKS
jgi:outer membrane protein assembly factor BamD